MDKKTANNITLLALFVIATGLMMGFIPGNFVTIRNLHNMGRQLPEYGLLALANMLAMITGGIDLSVVSITSVSGVAAGVILSHYSAWGLPVGATMALGILVALVVAVLCGVLNGILIAYAGVPAIIATLGTNGVYLGIAIAVTKGAGIIGFPNAFLFIGNGQIASIPTQFIIFVVAVVFVALLLTRTKQGLSMYLYGSNPLVARFSGINSESVLMKTYIAGSVLCGLSAIIIISGVDSVRAGYGSQYLLLSVLIVVMGGTNPAGGFGTVAGVVLSILVVQVLQSGLNIIGFSAFFLETTWGVLLLALVVFHYFRDQIFRTLFGTLRGKRQTRQADRAP